VRREPAGARGAGEVVEEPGVAEGDRVQQRPAQRGDRDDAEFGAPVGDAGMFAAARELERPSLGGGRGVAARVSLAPGVQGSYDREADIAGVSELWSEAPLFPVAAGPAG
jgi:hypothetical protein